eukprot:scaffold427478_cov37-Prasinocladus_malaysianus.AAC.2
MVQNSKLKPAHRASPRQLDRLGQPPVYVRTPASLLASLYTLFRSPMDDFMADVLDGPVVSTLILKLN